MIKRIQNWWNLRKVINNFCQSNNLTKYVQQTSICYFLKNEAGPLFKHSFKNSLHTEWQILSILMTVLSVICGIISTLPDASTKYFPYMKSFYFKLIGVILVIFLLVVIYHFIKLAITTIDYTWGSTKISFFKQSFILNMITMLYKNTTSADDQHDLVFAVGINKTKLLNYLQDNASSIHEDDHGILNDYAELMKNVNIDYQKTILDRIKAATVNTNKNIADLANGNLILETLFPNGIINISYIINNATIGYELLNGSTFTVAYYINSYGDKVDELLANPRVSIIGLFNYYAKHLANLQDRNIKTTIVLPLIGTGGGSLPYRNSIMEITNNLSKHYASLPSEIIIPIHSSQIISNGYEALSTLDFFKKWMNKD